MCIRKKFNHCIIISLYVHFCLRNRNILGKIETKLDKISPNESGRHHNHKACHLFYKKNYNFNIFCWKLKYWKLHDHFCMLHPVFVLRNGSFYFWNAKWDKKIFFLFVMFLWISYKQNKVKKKWNFWNCLWCHFHFNYFLGTMERYDMKPFLVDFIMKNNIIFISFMIFNYCIKSHFNNFFKETYISFNLRWWMPFLSFVYF